MTLVFGFIFAHYFVQINSGGYLKVERLPGKKQSLACMFRECKLALFLVKW